MAKISAAATKAAAKVVREILRRHSDGKPPNIRAATRAASRALVGSSRWEGDKRLLREVFAESAYGWQMQEKTLYRLALLLEKIETGAKAKLGRAVLSEIARKEVLSLLREHEWAELPYGAELAHLRRALDPELQGRLRKFEQWAIDRGHNRWRVFVSTQRILAPLACYSRTGGVERAWHEFKPAEQRDFIKWGIARERIMLRMAPAHIRAIERFPVDQGDRLESALDALDLPHTEEWRRRIARAMAVGSQ